MKLLEDKVVVVTGGASGIGRGIARVAARHGARAVIIADMTDSPREGGTPIVEELRATCEARFIRTDVADPADAGRMIEASGAYGGVDLMVCNAGIALGSDGPGISPRDFHALLDVNLAGVLHGAQAAATQMQRLGKPGAIVATSSMGGLRGSAATVGYSASKGGVCLLVASLADAWGPLGIRVNAVCPGVIETQLSTSSAQVAAVIEPMRQRTPLRRIGQPEDVGEVVAWLGSDCARFVTGVSLPVDGGLTAVL